MPRTFATIRAAASAAAMLFVAASNAAAHCDRLDGPVVKAAQAALAAGDARLVLIWVPAASDAETQAAFDRTLAVRALGADAKALADRYFFETVVRLHRAGEGEPYYGLQPAGLDPGPAISAADRAVETGSLAPVLQAILPAVERGLRDRFADLARTKARSPSDVERGREYVKAYVEFLHYVERVHGAAHASADAHDRSATPPAPPSR
jgi:uncharacterized protein DUF6448